MAFPTTLAERVELYANALYETRMRLRMIEQLGVLDLPPLFLHESCQLQLRLAAECLAIGCLAAQGDFATHKAFAKEYAPPIIFKALADIYPGFFPNPSSLTKTEAGWHFDGNVDRPSISRAEIEEAWNLSGSHLHRASAKRYVKRTNEVDFKPLRVMVERFWTLIVDHSIIVAPTIPNATASILHVMMDREGEGMRLDVLHVDKVTSSIRIEEFNVARGTVA